MCGESEGEARLQSVERYSRGAIALHWLIALALAGEIALGFAMPKDASGFAEYQLHKSIGITILLLSLLRLGWRFTHARPAPLEGGFTGFLARAVHAGFYIFMVAMPLTGWALVSTDEIDVPTLLYGVVPLPHLPLNEGLNEIAEESHELLAWGGLALFVLHVGGALRHHVLIRDSLLSRMSLAGSGFVLAMLAAVLALGLGVLFGVSQDRELQGDGYEAPAEAAESSAVPVPSPERSAQEDLAEQDPAAEEVDVSPEANVEDESEIAAPAGPPPSWSIQPGRILRFTATNAGSALNGSFSSWSGNIAMDPEAPESAAITIRVDLASATLGDSTQDNMLRGADFFDASNFPQATWRSTSVRRISGNRYEADGTLSLKGASRPQRINFTLSGSGNRRSVEGSASIDRNAFAIGTGSNAENLAGTVRLSFTFDAMR